MVGARPFIGKLLKETGSESVLQDIIYNSYLQNGDWNL